MEVWQTILVIIFSFVFEFIISFFFNYKIYWITKDRFSLAGIYGASATFLYMIMSGLIVYISAIYNNPWFIVWSAALIALGNYLSTISVKYFQDFLANKKIKNQKVLEHAIYESNILNSNEEEFIAYNIILESKNEVKFSEIDVEINDNFFLKK